ncbi:MAG: hypothetical protein AAF004_11865 [Pseudomonadota bacterium]
MYETQRYGFRDHGNLYWRYYGRNFNRPSVALDSVFDLDPMAFRHLKSPIVISLLLAGCSSLPNSYESQLAEHLESTGAKMYGAYWCPHCAAQKQYFKGAASRLPYIECAEDSLNAQVELCQAAEITAYPTWVIEGEYHQGAQPLSKLARLSGFESIEGDKQEISDPDNFSPAN